MPLRVAVGLACALAAVLATRLAGAAWPEPWSDDDPAAPPTRLAVGDYGFRGRAEYRAQGTYVNPIDLSSETYYRSFWLTHRLRLDGAVDYEDTVKITTSVDALDGVLWGDNGNLGTDPEPSNGAHVNTNNVNVSQLCMTLDPGANPVDPHSYHYGFCPADVITVRRLYGDVVLPVGLLRVGRQAFTEGSSVAVNDGDGRRNRFGVADRGNSADRILFATKPLEAFKQKDLRDRSENNGFFLILAYDQLVIDEPQLLGFNLHEVIAAARYLAPEMRGAKDVELRLFYTYRWDGHFGTNVDAVGGRAVARFGNWFAGVDATGVLGGTSEVSQAFHLITNDPAVSQAIRQLGARAVVRYDRPTWTAYLEGDYASGSSDTSLQGPLTQFHFAEDTNVGLLLFKQVFAYQTAREAAAATALLNSLNAPTVPVESIATNGALTDALVLFPQFDLRPVEHVLLRGGVLFAWAPAAVFDPIATAQRRSAGTYQNIAVNFNGGAPGRYYGTELDGRAQWRYLEHFALDLEGAALFPGSALRDEDGHAVNSFLVQARTTFFF
ncbi:MAG TPA: hypothetical protein VHS09_10615 [Polyangiaceae bacterium]|nr:hypothetical protein [Polyangiaceae bacterium]